MSMNDDYESCLPAFNEAFRIKQNAVQLAEEQLHSLCGKSADTIREIEKAREKKYCLSSHLKMTEYRLKEKDNTVNECHQEYEKAQAAVSEFKSKLAEQINDQNNEEQEFDQNVLMLTEKMCNGRGSYDQQTIENEIKELLDTNNAVAHELANIQKDLNSLKFAFNLDTTDYIEHVISSCLDNRLKLGQEIDIVTDRAHPLIDEGKELVQAKINYEKKLDELKLKVNN